MLVILKHEVNPIKNGWSARSPLLGLTAHGFSQDVARLNLQTTIRLLLTPFEREGNLREAAAAMGLETSEGGGDSISVILS